MPDAVLGGIRCHWREEGQGRPLVLLHAALSRAGQWQGLARSYPKRRLLMPDLPGHGESGPWEPHPTVHDQCTDMIAAFLDQIGPDPVEVVAHSFSATVMLRLAVEKRARIARMVLIEPVLFAAAEPFARADYAAHCEGQYQAMQAGDWAQAARLFLKDWGALPLDALSAPQRDYVTARMPFIAATGPDLLADAAGILRPDGLEAVDCPVVLIEGGDSIGVVGGICDTLAARLPQARRTVLVGAGHMLPLTHPQALAAEIAIP